MSNRDRVGGERGGSSGSEELAEIQRVVSMARTRKAAGEAADVLGFGIHFGSWDQQNLLADLDEK